MQADSSLTPIQMKMRRQTIKKSHATSSSTRAKVLAVCFAIGEGIEGEIRFLCSVVVLISSQKHLQLHLGDSGSACGVHFWTSLLQEIDKSPIATVLLTSSLPAY